MAEELTPSGLKELGEVMAKAAEKVGGLETQIAEIRAKVEDKKLDEKVGHLADDLGKLETYLRGTHGVSGSQDFKHEFNKFIQASYFMTKYGRLPAFLSGMEDKLASCAISEKAAAAFTTGTGAAPYGGYFVPTEIWDSAIYIKDIYGKILPRLTRATVPAGGSFRVPMVTNQATAYLIAQGTELTEEGTPITFGSATLAPKMCGTWLSLQNELLESAQSNITGVLARELLRAIVRKQEESVIQGEDSGDDPHDGLLVISSTNDQTNLALSPTLASMTTFHSETVADVQSLYDPSEATWIMHPAKISLLMGSTVGASELTGALSWGSPRDGVPPTCLGYDLIAHPMCLISTTYWTCLFHHTNVVFAESGPAAISFNPNQKWTTNQTLMRAMTHFDFTVGLANQISKADHATS